MIKRLGEVILILGLSFAGSSVAYAADDPRAAPGAAVVADKARFTLLTTRVVRLEYDASGRFEDAPSLALGQRPELVRSK